MAQLVEQLIRNEQVVGSSPTISSTVAWSAVCPPIHLYGSEGFAMLGGRTYLIPASFDSLLALVCGGNFFAIAAE